jgi:dynein intermediate chain
MLDVDLSEEQRTQIYSASDFLEFVESSSKIVQRALSDGYDYIKDYTSRGEGGLYAHRHPISLL